MAMMMVLEVIMPRVTIAGLTVGWEDYDSGWSYGFFEEA